MSEKKHVKKYYGYYYTADRKTDARLEERIHEVLDGRLTVTIFENDGFEKLIQKIQPGDVFASPAPHYAAKDVKEFFELLAILQDKRVQVRIPPLKLRYDRDKKFWEAAELIQDELIMAMQIFTQTNKKIGRPAKSIGSIDARFVRWYNNASPTARKADLHIIAEECGKSISTIRRWKKIVEDYKKKEDLDNQKRTIPKNEPILIHYEDEDLYETLDGILSPLD